ncbi:S-layer homology domain-containing protein [Lysinibacillus sp. FSL K6-0232]|uniref:S-layer homology domain-containing protein n=1 Tax=Lysinibacillus sp. FSL K6-0232 TaxID=2921425 RepID=UPI0030FC5706
MNPWGKSMKQSYKSNRRNGLVRLCIALLLIQSFLITVPYDNVSAQGSFHPALSDRWGGVQQIAGGRDHSLALTADGKVFAWGKNKIDETMIPIEIPDEAQSNIVSVSAGDNHSLALTASGEVIAWEGAERTEVPEEAKSGIAAIAAGPGAFHSLALTSSGEVIAWGRNDYGQANVPDTAKSGVKAIAAGYWHSLALNEDGDVIAWGDKSRGKLNVPEEVQGNAVAISAGVHHSLALTESGKVFAWGRNEFGESDVPEEAKSDVVAIAAGYAHSLALKSDGSVIAWGISDNTESDDHGQTVVPDAAKSGVIAIAAGFHHSLALKEDGTIVAWGDNRSGQLNIPTSDLETIKLTDQSGGELEFLFDVSEQEYTVLIDNSVTSVNVLATLENPEYADVYVNGKRQSDQVEGVKVEVEGEQTVVQVKVSPYLQESKTYTIKLLREAEPEQVSKPVASPAGGAVPAGTMVTLSTTTEGATVYYTTDGSMPSRSSMEYTAPIEVTGGMTLKAIAVKDGMLDSEVLEEHYTIATIPAPANLTASAADRSVTLKWDAVTGTGSVTYAVYQAEGTSAPVDPANWKLIQSNVTANSYNVTGLTNGTTYAFVVKAITVKGASDFSNVAIATPRAPGGNSGSGGGGGGRMLSNNADLADLQVWAGGKPLKLSPSFASGTTEYTARTEAEQVELVVKEAHSAAKVILHDKKVITDRVKVDLEEGDNTIELTVQAENGTKKTYTLTIYREMPKPNEPVIAFTDIAGHWAEDYIMRAAAKGIVSGYPDGTFKPNHPVTRAEFTVMLAGALKLEGQGAALTFTDHDQIGGWAKQAVAQAVQAGIVDGYNDGSFRPNAQITRVEIAVMIARALKLQLNANTTTGFADDEAIPQWAKGAVEAIRKLGIVDGRGGNRFVPNETATRAEATVMLLRLLDR